MVDEYGAMLRRIFGEQITERFLDLLYTHIGLTTSLITAQIERNTDVASEVTRLLYENAEETASFLASINPFWDESILMNRLNSYVQSTIEQSTTFLTGEYDRNIDIFARILTHAENTGNEFALGLFNYVIAQKYDSH